MKVAPGSRGLAEPKDHTVAQAGRRVRDPVASPSESADERMRSAGLCR
jgi:hypothetical protein